MAESIRETPLYLRTCVLYEFLEKKSVFDAYKNFCRKLGDSAMDYAEFEFWFLRFSQGKFDLNHDRSLDPKSHSFTDLLVPKIVEKLIENVELNERMTLRNVCKTFRNVIDNSAQYFKTISISATGSAIELELDNHPIQYTRNCQKSFCDLAVILSYSNLKLERLEIREIDEKIMKRLWAKLDTLNQKIHVESAFIQYETTMEETNILKYLEPGTLKTITLDNRIANQTRPVHPDVVMEALDRVIELEQYKQAEMLHVWPNCCQESFSILGFLNCPRLTFHFYKHHNKRLGVMLLKIVRSTEMKFVILKTQVDSKFGSAKDYLIRNGGEVSDPNRPNVIRVPIKKSNDFFEVQLNSLEIRIERKSF
ncbi:hypothetical protein CRE_09350 [Caenorhabditis remanei]|uniref:F-box domain-containing protein n=1 Tax=Caenorhabditis remanei TaxID=31234 RepID=E3LIB3_CAERE|nr:hypothetical protein CRE_09350 [Caenorhabditis remanei]